MRAAVVEQVNKLVIRDVKEPIPGPGDVKIRVKASGICGTDLHILHGDFIATYPIIPGHEFSGEVVELGAEVTNVSVGDRMVIDPVIFCGRCLYCQTNRQNQCYDMKAYGVNEPGGFGEFVTVSVKNLYPIENLGYTEAAFAEPLACVLLGVSKISPQPGERALVFGAGPIGLLMAQAVRAAGAHGVVVVDKIPRRLKIAEELGFEVTFPEKISSVKTGNHGFENVIDCTGQPSVVEDLISYVSRSGKILFFGVCPPSAKIEISPYQIYLRDLTIFGSFSLCQTMESALRWLKSGAIRVDKLLSHQIGLEEFPQGLKLIGQPDTMKIQVVY